VGLAVVSLGFVAVHVVLVGLDRPINWDEAVYLTQVVGERPTVFFEPHRTRGMPLLVAPIAVFDPSMVALRLYLVLLGAAGLYAAFATWIRTIGPWAALAAALYAGHWVSVFYAVEVLPSFPSGLLAVAAAGLAASFVGDEAAVSRRTLAAVAGVFLVYALVRPPDAVLVGLGTAAALAVLRPSTLVRYALPAAVGGVVGLGIWFVEGAVRFGFAPWRTMSSASEYSVEVGRVNLLPLYLRSLETRLRCAGGCLRDYVEAGAPWELPPTRTTAVLVVSAILVALALAVGRASRGPAFLALTAAVPVVLFYGYAGGVMNLRYMMPAFALGTVAIAVGVGVLWRLVGDQPAGIVVRALVGLGVLGGLVWQVGYGVDRVTNIGTRHRAAAIADALDPHLDGSPCVIATAVNYPQLQYWTRCPSSTLRLDGPYLQPPLGELGSYVDVRAEVEAGAQAFAIVRGAVPEDSTLADWEALPFEHERYGDDFTLLRHPPGVMVPPPPCPADLGGPERDLAQVLSAGC
jgi:hypothetical protein